MRFCFDLDGTLCTDRTDMKYHLAQPLWDRINEVNRLAMAGHYIIIDTARGSHTDDDWEDVTRRQLKHWRVRYDELRVGKKPFAHRYVDDRAVSADDYFKGER